MSKRIAGKRWFEALGRRHESLGITVAEGKGTRALWPIWARQAYFRGRLYQMGTWDLPQTTERAMVMLQACNDAPTRAAGGRHEAA